jgi:hypothetical protein
LQQRHPSSGELRERLFRAGCTNVEDLLFEGGVDVCHETVWMWWNRFGPMFAGDRPERGIGPRVSDTVVLHGDTTYRPPGRHWGLQYPPCE